MPESQAAHKNRIVLRLNRYDGYDVFDGSMLVSVNTWSVVEMDVDPSITFAYDVRGPAAPGITPGSSFTKRVCDMTRFDDIEIEELRVRGVEIEIRRPPIPDADVW